MASFQLPNFPANHSLVCRSWIAIISPDDSVGSARTEGCEYASASRRSARAIAAKDGRKIILSFSGLPRPGMLGLLQYCADTPARTRLIYVKSDTDIAA